MSGTKAAIFIVLVILAMIAIAVLFFVYLAADGQESNRVTVYLEP